MPIDTPQNIIELKRPGSLTDPRLDDFVALAELLTCEEQFGDLYDYAVALLVLHWMTLDDQGGGDSSTPGSGVIGGVKSEKEGDLARSYGLSSNISERNAYLSSTAFGMELLQLYKSCLILPRTRNVIGICR